MRTLVIPNTKTAQSICHFRMKYIKCYSHGYINNQIPIINPMKQIVFNNILEISIIYHSYWMPSKNSRENGQQPNSEMNVYQI